MVDVDNKVLQNITNSEYTQFPTYSYTFYFEDGKPGEYRIIKVAHKLHSDILYSFSLSDLNSNPHFEGFVRMVNSLKFFS